MDNSYLTKAYVELFHILFMGQFAQKLDSRLYALKGGCNLRFFLGSQRYSEDIDIDVHTVAQGTLKNTVDRILSGSAFQRLLQTRRLSIADFSTPKQTSTTQRWKVQLKVPDQSLLVNTKIEFSRRGLTEEVATDAVDHALLITYKLHPIFMSHYTAQTALQQKASALILRSEVQARDVFDIYHLIQSHDITLAKVFTKDELQVAIDNAINITFPEFKSQVISYLQPEDQPKYDNEAIWHSIVIKVCETLEQSVL